jgi:hypothetical protein
VQGTPAIDALEDFLLTLARVRRDQPPEPKTIEPSAEETPMLVAVHTDNAPEDQSRQKSLNRVGASSV